MRVCSRETMLVSASGKLGESCHGLQALLPCGTVHGRAAILVFVCAPSTMCRSDFLLCDMYSVLPPRRLSGFARGSVDYSGVRGHCDDCDWSNTQQSAEGQG